MGEYFGASLTVSDVTGDKYDDIIVGAPMYTPKDIKGYEEVGCIYQLICNTRVYFIHFLLYSNAEYNLMTTFLNLQGKFKKNSFINVIESKSEEIKYLGRKSRLGSALASLGDINDDGYNDIAVGAPYANEKGMVLIFFGSKDGINNKNIMFLHPEPNIRGFGISISRGIDFNNNGANGKPFFIELIAMFLSVSFRVRVENRKSRINQN